MYPHAIFIYACVYIRVCIAFDCLNFGEWLIHLDSWVNASLLVEEHQTPHALIEDRTMMILRNTRSFQWLLHLYIYMSIYPWIDSKERVNETWIFFRQVSLADVSLKPIILEIESC